MKISVHKKFILNQTGKQLDEKTEISVLAGMLLAVEKEERYEMAAVIYNRLKVITYGYR